MVQRGVDERFEQNPNLLIRDTRPLGVRIKDFFSDSKNLFATFVVLAVATVFFPYIADVIFVIGTLLFLWSFTRKRRLPFRMPQRTGLMDYNDPLPGSTKPRKARGICFLGNDRRTREELWFNNDDMRTHMLIFGSTGSGKTEALVSISFNALVQGSGFIYVDGKGDNSLYAKIFSLTRRMGREDDLLLVNFMTGARDVVGAQETKLSNTMNPFARGSSSMLSQLVVSLMDSGQGSSPDADMWKGRAIVFVEALMKILVYMRDQGKILLDANTIRNYFILERLESITIDKSFYRHKQEPVPLNDVPEIIMEPLLNYVLNLPGYNKANKGRQSSMVLEQHGFITMQLTRVFGSLADTYGHIIRTNLAEVDFKDVVLNRRILVVLLPALEKSPDELSNLGKVIVASLKAMMAAGLGDTVEGSFKEVIERKPTNSSTPFLCILDEYGYYAVPGFSVVPAQARSLGFSAVFAGQDLPAFQKASKEEAASIGANTNIKICMKLEDPVETWDFFSKTAGETYVTKVDSFQVNQNSITNSYLDTKSSSAEKRARIDLLDLKDQREGEAHIFFKSRIVRATMFYANPQIAPYMRLNHFVKVELPSSRQLNELFAHLQAFDRIIHDENFSFGEAAHNEDILLVVQTYKENEHLNLIERGVSSLLAYHNHLTKTDGLPEIESIAQDLTIFNKVELPPITERYAKIERYADFGASLLLRSEIKSQVLFMERLLGQSDTHAGNIADEIVKDMELATQYPPKVEEVPPVEELMTAVRKLKHYVVSKQDNVDEGVPQT